VTRVSKSNKSLVRRNGRRPALPISTSGRNPIDRLGIETLFSRNEKIFRKGQSARHIYKVMFGCVRTFIKLSDGRRLINSFYFPSDYFGLEMHEKHNLSAEAATPSMVLVIGKKELTSRAAIDIAVSKYMLNITNVELQRAQNRCRFRKLHPLDSRSPANQNMIAGCSQLPSFSCACCATVSSRDDGLKPKSWCCGINSTSCSSARHIGYV
jgi:hypothetical protein